MAKIIGIPKVQYFDLNGEPLSGGKLYTYEPGTTTNKATYPTVADAEATTNANANPIILDSRGEANVVIVGDTKFLLTDSDDTTVWTVDNIRDGSSSFLDSNGNEVITSTAVASAVNQVNITNAATGNSPKIGVAGDDTNIGLRIGSKGSGDVVITDSSDDEVMTFTGADSAVNYINTTSSATGVGPILGAVGDDTNIAFNIESKGTGDILLRTDGDEEILSLNPVSSAVNYLEVTSSATGNPVLVEAKGDDSNIGLRLISKGTGVVDVLGGNGTVALTIADVSSGVNYFSIVNSVTTAAVPLTVAGTDTNIDLDLVPKGTGVAKVLGTADASAEIRLLEDTDNGTDYVAFKCPTAVTTSYTLTLPTADSAGLLESDGAGTLSFNNSIPTDIATAAEMEAASSTTAIVTPGRVGRHPGVAKFWTILDGTGTPALTESFNVSSVSDIGTGNYELTLTTSFSGVNYSCYSNVESGFTGDNSQYSIQSSSAVRVIIYNSTPAQVDRDGVTCGGFGDQ